MQMTTTLRNVPDCKKLVPATITATNSQLTGERTIWFADATTGKSFMVVLTQNEAANLAEQLASAPGSSQCTARHWNQVTTPSDVEIEPVDGGWYWVKYEGLGQTYEAPAIYKSESSSFYSWQFTGIPRRQVTVLRTA